MKTKAAVESLSALAHEGRLAAFRLLVKAGPEGLPAGVLARKLGAPPSSLSTSLAILTQAGLARSRRDGRSIIYTADFTQMGALMSFLVEDCCGGAPEVCAPMMQAALACPPAGKRC